MRLLEILWVIVRTAAGALGWGVRLLDYRKVDEHVYDATRWVTFFFLPVVPLRTLRIRPRTASTLNLGAAVQTRFDFDRLGESATPPARIVRMYLFAWLLVPMVMATPLAAVLTLAKTQDGAPPSSTKTALLVASAIWIVVVAGVLNHRREKLFDWHSAEPS